MHCCNVAMKQRQYFTKGKTLQLWSRILDTFKKLSSKSLCINHKTKYEYIFQIF